MAVDIKKHIGRRVRLARDQAGLTQEKLAEKTGVTTATISNLERGTVLTSVTTLEQIASSLNVSLTFFVDGLGRPRKVSPERMRAEDQFEAVILGLSDAQLALATRLLKAVADYPATRK